MINIIIATKTIYIITYRHRFTINKSKRNLLSHRPSTGLSVKYIYFISYFVSNNTAD